MLKFDVQEEADGYDLVINLPSGTIRVQATEGELRRLMIDLLHDLGIEALEETTDDE